MKLHITPSKIAGRITVPGSKSHTIRAIVAGLLANGRSIMHSPLVSADTISTVNAAKQLGAKILCTNNEWIIDGTGGKFSAPAGVLDMGNSGTGLRLLTAVAATAGFPVTFDGDSSLRTRPMAPLLNALKMLNVRADNDHCPFTICGPLRGGHTEIKAVSSQFLTALLFAAPLAGSITDIEVTELNEAPYVGITMQWLDRCGILYANTPDMLNFVIPSKQQFKPFNCAIPADFSTACFPLVAGCIAGNGIIDIANLDFLDVQGDKAVFNMLESMGAVYQTADDGTTSVTPAKLNGAVLDLNATPDALPIMAVAATAAQGETRLVNAPQARIKETDRIKCMTCELRKMGAEVEELPDGMIIHGSKLHGAKLNSYADHRIAMALAIAALTADSPSTINEAESIGVTYPGFICDFQRLGAVFSTEEQ